MLDKQVPWWYNVQAVHKRPTRSLKKVKKTFEKALDKRVRMWYNSKALRKAERD